MSRSHHLFAAAACAAVALVPIVACEGRDGATEPETTGVSASHHKPTHKSADFNKQLAELRAATARFHNFDRATGANYGTEITNCWFHSELGGQGYHYGDLQLIGDGRVSLLEPELLMYEPQPGGHMRLVGVEYIVPLNTWSSSTPPQLLGQTFHEHNTLPLYVLHVWLWRQNPAGIFADWNPLVSCEFAESADDRA